ncbi:hypothetical protein ColLi_04350 [Colletotrichum liriopes]|uniref:FAD-binding domain-containing protein n=1 Tax=Colletotrichum liriopes TaxID=708192 RepID=A0AA37GJB3_9PEZI|nr:hypothetical protein ColLi_04350 [Colletotrichum liriopes]
MEETDVVVIGAGPSGLAIALALGQLQIKIMRDKIHASEYTELKLDCAVNGIRHDANGVEAVYREKGAGEDSVIRGKYLIGADGKRGFVRKGYLEEKGIEQKTGL